MKFKDVIVSEEKQRLDPHCWSNKKIGNPKTKVKGGVRVNNCVPKEGIEEAMRPIPVDDRGNRIPDRMSGNEPRRPFGQPGDSKSSPMGVVTYTPTGIVHRSNHGDVTPRPRAVPEGSQRVDSLVTDALKVVRGSDYQMDALKAIKTVLGDREYNGRRGHYNFYVRQLMDMLSQEGLAEGNTEVRDNTGKVVSWRNDTEWHKAEKNKKGQEKDPRGVVTHLSDVARRKTEKQDTKEGKIDFAKKIQKNVDKSNKAVVKTNKEVGSRVADIGAGGKEYNVKTDKAWDDAHKAKESKTK